MSDQAPVTQRNIAFVCSGQGSQSVGMGQDFYTQSASAKKLFDLAGDLAGFDVADCCFNGPAERLSDTRYTQPCLVTFSLAIATELLDHGVIPKAVAGFSLGEYAAHGIAATMRAQDVISLVALRGRLMAQAAEEIPGGMLVLLKADQAQAQALCDACSQGQVLEVANLNCPGQTVISGENEALARAQAEWAAKGGRAVPVATSGAFHSSLMKDAAQALKAELDTITFHPAGIPLYCNVNAQPLEPGHEVKSLVEQMYSSVLWEKTIRAMISDGIDTFIELGPGGVLCGMIKRIDKDVERISIGSYEEFVKALELLGKE